jgi:hypothetical protein
MSRRTGALEFVLTALLGLAMVVLATVVTARRDLRVDLTEGQRRTLSAQTRTVLGLVERPIELLAFYQDVPFERQRLRDLVGRFGEYTPHLELEFIDLARRPDLAEVYQITVNGTVLLIDGDLRVRVVDPDEAALSSALLRLVRSDPPVIMFTTGHGESAVEDESAAGWRSAAEMLADQNFEIRMLSTPAIQRIPPETDLVVMAGPQTDLTERERTFLLDFVLRGGSLLILLEPFGASTADSFVGLLGVVAEPGFVVDVSPEQSNLTNRGDPRIVLAIGGDPDHPITRGFSYNTLYPLARALSTVQPPLPGVQTTRLVSSQPQSWIETDPAQAARGQPRFDDGVDRPGPLALGYAVEIDLRRFDPFATGPSGVDRALVEMWEGRIDLRDPARADTLRVGDADLPLELRERARIVVFGDADFASNANLRVQGNGQLLLSTTLWLLAQEDRIAIGAGPDLNDPVVLQARQLAAARWIGVVAVPAFFFAAGAFSLWRRRRWV